MVSPVLDPVLSVLVPELDPEVLGVPEVVVDVVVVPPELPDVVGLPVVVAPLLASVSVSAPPPSSEPQPNTTASTKTE